MGTKTKYRLILAAITIILMGLLFYGLYKKRTEVKVTDAYEVVFFDDIVCKTMESNDKETINKKTLENLLYETQDGISNIQLKMNPVIPTEGTGEDAIVKQLKRDYGTHAPEYYRMVDEYGNIWTLDKDYQDYVYYCLYEAGMGEYLKLFLGLMWHESHYQINVISSTDDYGLCQVNICNHESLTKKYGIQDFLEPYGNIRSGTDIFIYFMRKENFDVQRALMCYNTGSPENDTITYPEEVLEDVSRLEEID